MERRACAIWLAVPALFLALAGSAPAQNNCAGKKIKAVGKTAKCLLGLDAKEAKSGVTPDPLKVQKCKDKLSSTFTKSEAEGSCGTTGDAQDVGAKVDAFVADVDSELGVGLPNGCKAATLRPAGKKAACLLGLEAKEAATGVAPDPAKVTKCKDKLTSTYAKGEARGGCGTTGDAQDIGAKVDAFVADTDGALSGAPTTTTTAGT